MKCKICGNKKIYAKGLCNNCYHKEYYRKKAVFNFLDRKIIYETDITEEEVEKLKRKIKTMTNKAYKVILNNKEKLKSLLEEVDENIVEKKSKDKYILKYLRKIKKARNDKEVSFIIDRIYEDGFEDGLNFKKKNKIKYKEGNKKC